MPLTALKGKYLVVVDGQQKGNGRLIDHAYFDPGYHDIDVITICLAGSDYFVDDTGTPQGLIVQSGTTPTTNASWVQIQEIKRTYTADLWPLKAFV